MAKPRVFISSTFYDLRYVREDLERFIIGIGYEPVRHEVGAIPYARKTPLEESAYHEVALCDVIVCIIGGRYGTESFTREGSITQNELEEALKKGIQVFIFVEQNVLSEYSTYQLNKDNKDIKYRNIDNVAIFEFIEKIHALPQNNPITPFVKSEDITNFLKAQWAGLFQKYLQEEKRLSEMKVLEEMNSVASTLKQLVTFLTQERRSKDDAIKTIILINHPAFRVFADLTGTPYRVFFTNRRELDKWLEVRGYKPIKESNMDVGSIAEWLNEKHKKYIKLTHEIFDQNDHLISMTEDDWQLDWLQKEDTNTQEQSDNDSVPF